MTGQCLVLEGHEEPVRKFHLLSTSSLSSALLSWSFDGTVKVTISITDCRNHIRPFNRQQEKVQYITCIYNYNACQYLLEIKGHALLFTVQLSLQSFEWQFKLHFVYVTIIKSSSEANQTKGNFIFTVWWCSLMIQQELEQRQRDLLHTSSYTPDSRLRGNV